MKTIKIQFSRPNLLQKSEPVRPIAINLDTDILTLRFEDTKTMLKESAKLEKFGTLHERSIQNASIFITKPDAIFSAVV